jgi:hypothetical protein
VLPDGALWQGWAVRRNRPEDQMDVRGRRRRPNLKDIASSTAVVLARMVCVVAGLAAMGVGLVGMLAGTGLGIWGASVGSVLLLIGLPWTWISVAFVAGGFAALLVIGAAAS